MLLDDLKHIGKVCPVCNNKLNVILDLHTKENQYQYTLTNNIYPLSFEVKIPFGALPEKIIIDKNDRIDCKFKTISAVIQLRCSNHFNIKLYSLYDELKDIDYIITINDLRIWSSPLSSSICKITFEPFLHGKYQFEYQSVEKLFSIPAKSITYWPLFNINDLNDKINKLLILI